MGQIEVSDEQRSDREPVLIDAFRTGPRVRDLMTSDVFTLFEHNSLSVLRELMNWRRIRHVPVVNEASQVVGLVTHRDFLDAAVSQLVEVDEGRVEAIYERIPISSIMQPDVVCVPPDMDLGKAARIMYENKYGCLPVVDDGRLVGILTEADFVKSFYQWDVSFN